MKTTLASTIESQFYKAEQLHPVAGLNTVTWAVRIEGPLLLDRLRTALLQVCREESVLRTSFALADGEVVRVLTDELPTMPLVLEEAPGDAGTLATALNRARKAIAPDGLPWQALLLRHGAQEHTFVFVAHRSIWDERSTQLFAARLGACYREQASADLVLAPDAAATGESGQAERWAEGARHFADGLRDAPLEYGFPLQAARRQLAPLDAAEVLGAWDDETRALLGRAGAAWGLSSFAIQTAALVYVVAQYCRQQRLVVGLPFDSRPVSAAARLGSFTSVLPLGIELREGTFAELARRLREQRARAERFADTPFATIVRECGRRSATAAHTLYQIAVVEEVPPRLVLDGCTCRPRPVPPPPQTIDLFARLGPDALALDYATTVIAHDIAQGLVGSMAAFLVAALQKPDRPLSELPVVSDGARQALLVDWNRTDEPAFLQPDLYAVLTRHVTPGNGKVALVADGRSLSYAALADEVAALADRLRQAGVVAGDLVGICLPRTVDMVVAQLAVLKLGAGYVPLDPAFPTDRLAYMVEHAQLKQIVTTAELRSRIPAAGFAAIDISEPRAEKAPAAPETAVVPPSTVAYVIYTSGSTGTPKGVAVPRAAVANFLLSMLQRPGIGPEDTLCAVTTLSFDIAVLELLAPLAAGATVVIATEAEARDPRLLIHLLRAHRATILQATPVTWYMLCAADWPGAPGLKALCGGEPLAPTLIAAILPRVGELWNMYGPTETTVWSTCHRIATAETAVSVGTPIHNTRVYVLDEHRRLVPPGVEGRLYLGGAGVALGYLHDESLTGARFLPDPFRPTERIYDTGDRARLDGQGLLYILGRTDFQVKIRGFRIELGEIETRLATFPGMDQVVCVARQDDPNNAELVGYYVLKAAAKEPSIADLRAHCGALLPPHMVPSHFLRLAELPRTPNGKVDRKALPKPGASQTLAEERPRAAPPKGKTERTVLEVWCEVLAVADPGINDGFFDLGGTSVLAFDVARLLSQRLGIELPVLKVFEHPTIAELARFIDGAKEDLSFIAEAQQRARVRRSATPGGTFDVAVIGMAGRFPGARNLDELWQNLRDGRETVTVFRREDLDPLVRKQDREDPSYIPARGVLEDADKFDAAFFGFTPSEAELMDPQLRVFLEVAWEAFEDAGYVTEELATPVGVWAGMGNNFYYLYNVLTRPDKLAVMGEITAEIANEKDHIAPRVSHKLNLRGPSLSVHTACSTGLVVVENAFQALVSYQVDMALAGAVDIRTPQKSGQRHEEGGVFSNDGHCRPYDAAATGTMFGEGAGAVVLKRLADALRDGDTIHAVIRGAAVNHDGGRKVSYLAPSVEGHARLIATALALADINPETVTFVEGHGTGTPIGDPIEVEALTRVYRAFTRRRRYCALGSIKGNFGHATTAAGIAGVLKVILAMRHRQIPPTVHFQTPNPRIDFASSPFFVNNRLLPWQRNGSPRRAAVSSFGFCGTNAHVVMEEPPPATPSGTPSRPLALVLMSARSREALDENARAYAAAMSGLDEVALADAAYTTHVGRKRFEYRRSAVLGTGSEAALLLQPSGPRSASLRTESSDPAVAFIFPGQGAQYINMGSGLYRAEPVFRDAVDGCAETLAPHLGCDVRRFLFPEPGDEETARQSLNNTFYTQPAIFTISYALAQQLLHWGITPSAFVGHSIGEFVAAALAGVMGVPDALRLVATRGRLMQDLPGGSMLSVRMAAEKLLACLPQGVDLAAANAPELSVVAGPTELVHDLGVRLSGEGVACRVLHTSHAFHSSMMDAVVPAFLETVRTVPLAAPRIPIVSTLTGAWVGPAEMTDPGYWAGHLRSPVRFSQAVQVLLADEQQVLVECGPRRTLATMALQHRPARPERVIASMPDSAEPPDEHPSLLLALGSLWMNGCRIDWNTFHTGERRRRGSLPSYRFQRRRFWLEPGNTTSFGFDPTTAGAFPVAPPTDATLSQGSAVPAPADDALKAAVIGLIQELQGRTLESVDEDAGFIALGLDSLLVTQFARAIRAKLGFEVTFRQLITTHSTIRLLIEAMRAQQASRAKGPGEGVSPDVPTPATPSQGELATTPAQREMWVVTQLEPDARCAYNDSLSLTLTSEVDEDALVAALRGLPAMHEALRGRFSHDGTRLVIDPQMDVIVTRHDLASEADADATAKLEGLVTAHAMAPYDLERGPLFRAELVRMPGQRRVVILGAHRAICDGWSLDVLLADLDRLYGSGINRQAAPKPSHTLRDFLALRATEQHQAQRKRDQAYWKDALPTLPRPPVLLGQGVLPARRTFAVRHARRAVASAVLKQARELSRANNLSVVTVFLASLASLLRRLSGADDLLIGLPVAGHPDSGMEDCVGALANLVPSRCRCEAGLSFIELCRRCHTSLLDAREHASLGFGEIVAASLPARERARAPLLAAVLTHVQKYPAGKLGFGGSFVDYQLNPLSYDVWPLGLTVVEGKDSLEVLLQADADRYGQGWLERRLDELERFIAIACASPAHSIDVVLPAASEPVAPSAPPASTPSARTPGARSSEPPAAEPLHCDIRAKVAEVFAQALDVPAVGLEDDFFAKGGSSLAAIAAMRELNAAFGLALSPVALFESSSVAAMARLIIASGGELKSTVVELHRGAGTPLYFICGIALYLPLAQRLPTNCFGIYVPAEESFFQNAGSRVGITIPELARRYAAAIGQRTPDGPCVLAGVSLGGLLAFEVARQLRRNGRTVANLVLLDPMLPSGVKRTWRGRARGVLHDVLGEGWPHRFPMAQVRKGRPVQASARQQKNKLLWDALQGQGTVDYLASVPTYDGRVLLIVAADRAGWEGCEIAKDLGWSPLLKGDVTLASVSGDHLGILQNSRTAELIHTHL